MNYHNLIKYASINVSIYLINSLLSYFMSYILILHLLSFIIVIVVIDAIIIQNDLKILEIKYKEMKSNNNIEYDLMIIKNKLDIILNENKTNENHIINIDIKDTDFNYGLAKKALVCSKSLSFIKKSPKIKDENPSQIIIPNIGEVIT